MMTMMMMMMSTKQAYRNRNKTSCAAV